MDEIRNFRERAARGLLSAAALVVIIAGMRAAADIIVPFLLALSIAIICVPPLRWMQNRNVPVTLAVTATIIGIVAALAAMGALIGTSVGKLAQDIPSYQDQVQGLLKHFMHLAHRMGWNVSMTDLHRQFNPNNAFSMVTQFFKGFGSVLGDGFLVVLTVLFLLFEAAVLPSKLATMSREERHHQSLELFSSSVDGIQRYVFWKTLVSLGLGLVVAMALWAMGVRYPMLWGLLAFLLNFVPNIGAFLSAIPPILLALLQGGWVLFGEATGALFVIHFVTGNIVEPILMGGRLGLSVLVVFVSLIFWGWVLGPIGMLLSVPLTMIVRIGFEQRPETQWLAILLGPAPAAREHWVLDLVRKTRKS